MNNEKVDIVVLNNASPLLKYEVIKNGILLKGNINDCVVYETFVLQEYLDHLRKIQTKYHATLLIKLSSVRPQYFRPQESLFVT